MNKVLITGGAGFIGTALASHLKDISYEVTLIDLPNKFSSLHDNFKCYPVDIRDYDSFRVLGDGFDCIYHLAAQTSGLISQEQPTLDVDTNVKGTLNVCNFARATNVPKIIFSSSMATYGDKKGSIQEQGSQMPLSNYGVSKKAAESYIHMFRQYGVKSTIFRLFNVYGPGQDLLNLKQGMASIFMAQAIQSTEIKVTGSLNRYRDFIYIDDVISALSLGLNAVTDNEVYNVGSGCATTVSELIDLILSVQGQDKSEFFINDIGSHDGDQFGSIADIEKLSALGWFPTTDLQSGLMKMYLYAKDFLL